ncbi:MAG: peptidylprolyl isomerase [Clostridiales bacterium]|nr:peptidylprolyl isomerase [Clostridiales bacterium]
MSQEILAVVAGKEITEADFEAFLQALPREQRPYLSNPQFREQCKEQMIAMHMFSQLGVDTKLDETEEFKSMLEEARREILAQLAVRETLKDVTVSEEETKAYYEENQKQFVKGGTVSAKHILVDSEEKCNEILEKIVSGATEFEAAAKEYSSCPSGAKGGDLGEFGKGQMVKEFEEAAFTAEIGHVVGPVKTQFGYHLIKVENKTEESLSSFEEVREMIARTLVQQKQNVAYGAKVAEMKENYLEK